MSTPDGVYIQSSTANPYGHRPWQTRLYSTFADFAFLKQPQNTILREDLAMRPEIYRPPEFLGAHTLVSGSGRILRRGRYQPTLGLTMPQFQQSVARLGVRLPTAPTYVVGAPRTISILPPSMVPPVPQPVARTPAGTVYALPGRRVVSGSPFMPPMPGELPATPSASAAAVPGQYEGQVIVVPGTYGAYWLISGGKRRHIAWQTAQRLYSAANPNWAISVTQAEIDAYPIGDPVPLGPGERYLLHTAVTPPAAAASPLAVSNGSAVAAGGAAAPGGSAGAAAAAAGASWFNSDTFISGIPNGYLAIGAAGVIFLMMRKKR